MVRQRAGPSKEGARTPPPPPARAHDAVPVRACGWSWRGFALLMVGFGLGFVVRGWLAPSVPCAGVELLPHTDERALALHTRHTISHKVPEKRFPPSLLHSLPPTYEQRTRMLLHSLDNGGGLAWVARQYAHAACLQHDATAEAWELLRAVGLELGHPQVVFKADAQVARLGGAVLTAEERERVRLAALASEMERASEEERFVPGTDHWWSAKQPRQQASPGTTAPVLHHLFTSPVMVLNVGDRAQHINARLAELAVHTHARFEAMHGQRGDASSEEANNDFFAWQMDQLDKEVSMPVPDAMANGTGWKQLADLPEWQELVTHIRSALATFLHATHTTPTNLPQENIARKQASGERSPSLYSWFSVHSHNSTHPIHIHDDAMLSAVYYARVPRGAGAIAFFDPRGRPPVHEFQDSLPYPPFTAHFTHAPKEGDVVVFPSWLPHAVLASHTLEPRVSVAFNLVGDWQGTEGSRLAIKVPASRL